MHQLTKKLMDHCIQQMDFVNLVKMHPDAILVVNGKDEIVYSNQVASHLFSRLPEDGTSLSVKFKKDMAIDKSITLNDLSGKEIIFKINKQAMQWHGQAACLYTLHEITPYRQQCCELEQRLNSDHLTGLYNSRGLELVAEHLHNVALRNKQPITAFYIDVNELKHINDTYGHSVGDAAIVETAEVINHTFRDADIKARVGGDEFVVMVLNDTFESTEGVLGRLRKEVEQRNSTQCRPYKLSISVGVGRYQAEQKFNFRQLIREADQRMYLAKKQINSGCVRQCNYYWPLTKTQHNNVIFAA